MNRGRYRNPLLHEMFVNLRLFVRYLATGPKRYYRSVVGQYGVILAKVGLVDRIRRALGGSPTDHVGGHAAPVGATAGYGSQLDLLCDTARDLCADAWVANRLTLNVKNEGGKQKLNVIPEAIPYLRAAYSIRRNELPPEVKGLIDGLAG